MIATKGIGGGDLRNPHTFNILYNNIHTHNMAIVYALFS